MNKPSLFNKINPQNANAQKVEKVQKKNYIEQKERLDIFKVKAIELETRKEIDNHDKHNGLEIN